MIYWQYTLFNLLSRCSQSIPLVLVFFSFFRLRKKILRQNFFFLFSIILIGVTDRIFFVHTHGFILYFFSFLFLLLIYTGLFFCGQFSFKAVICLILLVYQKPAGSHRRHGCHKIFSRCHSTAFRTSTYCFTGYRRNPVVSYCVVSYQI